MEVLDHEPRWWFLLRDGEDLLLDVNCSHGAFSYPWVMILTHAERERFLACGRDFLGQLASEVQDSGAGMRDSASPYRERNVCSTYQESIAAAVQAWRTANHLESLSDGS